MKHSRKRLTTAEWIEKAKSKHGNRYDYSNSEYKTSRKPIIVICVEHGSFETTPNIHMQYVSGGCQGCSKRPKITTEIFINRAKKLNYDNHDYSLVEYVSDNTKVQIVCRKHGPYWQNPGDHYNYQGCQECRYEKMADTRRQATIYKYGSEEIYRNWLLYRERCDWYTKQSYRKFKHIINPKKIRFGKTRDSYHLDHIYSCYQGFQDKIHPEIIGHYTNLQVIKAFYNREKGVDCGKTKDQLLEDFKKAFDEDLQVK